jgi:hypothetical protein
MDSIMDMFEDRVKDDILCETLWLRARVRVVSAALKKGGVLAVHRDAGCP